MKFPAKIVACVLPLFLTACFHFTRHQSQVQPLAPPIEDAPPPKPVPSPTELPPPVVSVPSQPPTTDASAQAPPMEEPKPPVKHKKPAIAPKTTLQASNTNDSPGVSAIGHLSSGEPSDLKRQAIDTIATIERGLSGIGRKLSDQEQKTAAQIREFLKQAKAALNTGDVDGANTLADKAKVLFGEISQ